ncbi:MAG: YbhB/YbcL family Raf kinase inhibitor-like protein [Actinobacteria bacterium]|nr:YbhB/YbcL family Raf kinase inhibitor-like protein [Actinomycetota bacterium]
MRRLLILTSALIVLIAVSSCRDDGRTLRDPPPGFQGVSISTTTTIEPGLDPGDDDSGFDTFDTTDTFDTGEAVTTLSIPSLDDTAAVTAPWLDGGAIDPRFSCEGLNISPALSWPAAPLGTAEVAITLEDLDVPTFVHWIIAGISPDTVALPEGEVPIGAYEATNSLGDIGYTGPCPSAGEEHFYVITVHYLGVPSGLLDGVAGAELFATIATAEVETAEVTGTFSRTD